MPAVAVPTALRSFRQHARPDDDPVYAACCNHLLLPRFVPKVEWKNNRNDEERVVETHASRRVSDTQRCLAHEAPNALIFHRAQDVVRSSRQNTRWLEESLVSERADDGLLTLHSRLDRRVVEHIPAHDAEARMHDFERQRVAGERRDDMTAFERLRDQLATGAAGRSHD